MGMLKEFKAFAVKGNVIDLAVGVIIGAAFGKIVASFVKDVLMPPIGVLLGGVDFTDLTITIQQASAAGVTPEVKEVVIRYGQFLQTMIDFLIVAFTIFIVIRGINKMQKKEEEAPKAPPAPSKEEVLLTEIRDAIRDK